MDNVATHVRPRVRLPRLTPEQYEQQVKPTSKDRLHTVEEFVEQLEQAIEERL